MTDPSAKTTPKTTESHATAKALVAEFMGEKQREVEELRKASTPKATRHAFTAALAVLCAVAWFAPLPAPEAEPRPTARVQRASARMSLFLAAQKVIQFSAQHGRLPKTLGEARVDGSTIVYLPGQIGSFLMSIHFGQDSLAYDSSQPLRALLGDAGTILETTGH